MSSQAALARPQTSARAWSVLFILCFVYVVNFLDRQLLSILAKPIQDSLHVTDSQLGRIGGLYFALFYCIIAIPVGWIADRTNRSRVLGLACALWSAATMACGFSRTYPQLVAARMAVGIGEAGGVPPSYAIISDTFPPGQRGTALGFYNHGPPLGQALGIAFGASIAAAYSWRHAFIALGAVGIAAALIVFVFVREPKRGGLDPVVTDAPVVRAGLWATTKMFFTTPALILMALAGGATQFITYGSVNFTTLFLMREKGMTLSEVAVWLALITGICMSGGIFFSGWLSDVFGKRSKRAFAFIPIVGLVIAAPLFAAFVHEPSWRTAVLFLAGPTFFNYFYLSPSVAFIKQEVRPDQRVLSGALLLLVMNQIGLGLGPTYVGAASDYLRAYDAHHSLQLALYSLLPFYVLAIVLFLWLAAIMRRAPKTVGAPA